MHFQKEKLASRHLNKPPQLLTCGKSSYITACITCEWRLEIGHVKHLSRRHDAMHKCGAQQSLLDDAHNHHWRKLLSWAYPLSTWVHPRSVAQICLSCPLLRIYLHSFLALHYFICTPFFIRFASPCGALWLIFKIRTLTYLLSKKWTYMKKFLHYLVLFYRAHFILQKVPEFEASHAKQCRDTKLNYFLI